MPRRLLMLLMVLCLTAGALTGCTGEKPESTEPDVSPTPIPTVVPAATEVPEPTAEPGPTEEPAPTEVPVSALLEPGTTPVLIDPIDKPTREPVVTLYEDYTSTKMGVTFKVPRGWIVEETADTNVRFVEPTADAKEGYPTQLIVRMYERGTSQKADDALAQLQEELETLQTLDWQSFKHNDTASAKFGSANGHYTYYTATYNNMKLRGRIIVFANKNALFMVRITCPQSYYVDYEDVYRRVRSTWKFN